MCHELMTHDEQVVINTYWNTYSYLMLPILILKCVINVPIYRTGRQIIGNVPIVT